MENSRPGAPAVNSRQNTMATMIIEVPMSPPIITSAMISTAPGTSGTSRWSQVVSSFSLRTSRSAPHSTSASLANSLGCTVSGPMISQFLLPLCEDPTASTSSSASTVPTSAG